MLLNVLGWAWIISGIVFSLRPGWLKDILCKKDLAIIRNFIFIISIIFSILLVIYSFRMYGFWARALLIVGLAGLVEAFLFFYRGELSKPVMNLLNQRGMSFYQVYSICKIILGAIMLSL